MFKLLERLKAWLHEKLAYPKERIRIQYPLSEYEFWKTVERVRERYGAEKEKIK